MWIGRQEKSSWSFTGKGACTRSCVYPGDVADMIALHGPWGTRRAKRRLIEMVSIQREVGRSRSAFYTLVRLLGHPVMLVEGRSWLFKITTPADLDLASALAAPWL